ncbi:ABC transporter ATP-binding protein [Pseudomarimonas salicorniae]|uniref:ABC transporter ATP-binding protein n=1 Tax=Pseudomarimonas salicorniae TaxID=2933270 RepID=A0ABT0GJX0_9GAMM|nr:ABC transporter ATP-binding protein [Lysobacter sp. CAU 1642]MCK7594836.1 ABC transporter ATP-binding protein [Lysobacter sp. CAU 1642]
MTLAIETEGLSRRFGERLAVDQVDLQVPTGSVYGFLGRNGAGKTTTIRLLLGLLRPTAGRARICGIDVVRDRPAAARRVGALLEAQGLYPHLSGRENLDLTRRLLALPRGEIDRVLELVELRAAAGRRVAEYSLGMRQRLGLARALLGEPSVLILDEPSNGLDPEGIAELRGFLRDLPGRSGATVLLSSHLLGEIEQTASHVGILCAGRLVSQGRLDALKAGLPAELLVGTDAPDAALAIARQHGFEVEAGPEGLLARLAAGEGIEQAAAALNQALCAAGLRVHALVPRPRSLESLYHLAGADAAPSPAA